MKAQKKTGVYIVVILACIWFIYDSWDEFVFAFDSTEGIGEIKSIEGNYFNLEYFHESNKSEIQLRGRMQDQRELAKYSVGEKVNVTYSKSYPLKASVKGMIPPSWIYGVFMMILCGFTIIGSLFKIYNSPND